MKTADQIRALTVTQPWATCILRGKTVENRTWRTGYRGLLAIHAGAGFDRDAASNRHLAAVVPDSVVTRGAILGVVTLADCHPAAGCCGPWGEPEPDVFHWVLRDPRELDRPYYCHGQRRLWTPDGALQEIIRRAESDRAATRKRAARPNKDHTREMALPGTPLGATPTWLAAVAEAGQQCQCKGLGKNHSHRAFPQGRCPANCKDDDTVSSRLYLAPDGRIYCGPCFDLVKSRSAKMQAAIDQVRADDLPALF